MNRDVDVRDISDGRFYTANDMVKADTGGCGGCSECCRSMVDTIILDPWDIYMMNRATGLNFAGLLKENYMELNVADGLILPNLKPNPETKACPFLNDQGRCRIHDSRPGFCRLFPLGRYYENRDFRYIVQTHECTKKNLAKIKVKKWLGIENLSMYEDYIRGYHFYLRDVEKLLEGSSEVLRRRMCLYILKNLFENDYQTDQDFYRQFEERLKEARKFAGFAEGPDRYNPK